MCTVTIIRHGAGIRLACNRDESRQRPAALPPRVAVTDSRQALMPIDPQSGGTWIAANDAGLIFTLLNAYAIPWKPNVPPASRKSRGRIIPSLLSATTLAVANKRLESLALSEWPPFRLVIADRHACDDFRFDGNDLLRTSRRIDVEVLMFTSSGLGDEVVDAPRRALLADFFRPGRDQASEQDAYHRHSWPQRRHLSVCMSRPEARTVSFTTVDVAADHVRMTYVPDAPDQPAPAISGVLNLARFPPQTKATHAY
ncbi:MAG: NRDE family protein [Planctomycetes bacterium]|nr:NRDE family protein [Planctomycetota bacterium]